MVQFMYLLIPCPCIQGLDRNYLSGSTSSHLHSPYPNHNYPYKNHTHDYKYIFIRQQDQALSPLPVCNSNPSLKI